MSLIALLLGVVLTTLSAPGYADLIDSDARYTNPNYAASSSTGFNNYIVYSVYGLAPALRSNETALATGPWINSPGPARFGNGYVKFWRESGYNKPPSTTFFNYCGNSLVLFFVGVVIIVYIYADQVSKTR